MIKKLENLKKTWKGMSQSAQVVLALGLGAWGFCLFIVFLGVVGSLAETKDISDNILKEEEKQAMEKQLEEEKAKREQAEKEKKELEEKIAKAETINSDLPEEVDGLEIDIELAKQANVSIVGNPEDTLYQVTEVVDGDTIKIETLGTLRLIGLDTPETKDPRKPVQCFGEEASKKAKELLSGKKVRLEFDDSQGRLDKYGRTLAYVFREDGYFFNHEMIKNGYAHEYTYNTPYKYQEKFKEAEQEAREGSKGFWSNDTCNGDTTKEAKEDEQKATTSTSSSTSSTSSSSTKSSTSSTSSSTASTKTTTTTTTPTSKYTCDCSKYCSAMASCDEAYYQLNTCGCSRRDGDSDGVPYEAICPGG